MPNVINTYQNVTLNICDDGSVFAVFTDGSTAMVSKPKDDLVIPTISYPTMLIIGTAGYMVRGILDCIVAKRNNQIKAFGECLKTTLLP
jgi:hypothetical protein